MRNRPTTRRGVTLLELLAVVTLLGIFTAMAAFRISPGTRADFGSQADTRRLALDFLQAQRRAISTGDDHYLLFTTVDSQIDGYQIYQDLAGGDVTVDSYRTFPNHLTVTVSAAQMDFTFEGTAGAAYQVTLTGPNRTWRVDIVPATGSARVREL
jgi:prepilin-type N-terminal cleavage/methylation domain-containing protein